MLARLAHELASRQGEVKALEVLKQRRDALAADMAQVREGGRGRGEGACQRGACLLPRSHPQPPTCSLCCPPPPSLPRARAQKRSTLASLEGEVGKMLAAARGVQQQFAIGGGGQPAAGAASGGAAVAAAADGDTEMGEVGKA